MICMHADDTAILSRHYDPNTLTQNINVHLAHLEIWFSVWKIAINTSKTEAISFFSKKRPPLKSRSKTKGYPGLYTPNILVSLLIKTSRSDNILHTHLKFQDRRLESDGTKYSVSHPNDQRDFEVKNCYESSGRDWSARSAPIGGEGVCRKWGIERIEKIVVKVRLSRWRASVPVSPSVCVADVLVFVGLRFAPELLCRPRKGR
ncbi:hypothetical protein TNCV_3344571 [Trichonephila clavipes]|nr:hypothetical protein TNCV_3344571 [Trichonephila clavipes]